MAKKKSKRELKLGDYPAVEIQIKLRKGQKLNDKKILVELENEYTQESLRKFRKSHLISESSKSLFDTKITGKDTLEIKRKLNLTQKMRGLKTPAYYHAINKEVEEEMEKGRSAFDALLELIAVRERLDGSEYEEFIKNYASPHIKEDLFKDVKSSKNLKPSEDEIRERKRKGEEVEEILRDYPHLTPRQRAAYVRNWSRKPLKKEKWPTIIEGMNDLHERFKWSDEEIKEYLKENFTEDSLEEFYSSIPTQLNKSKKIKTSSIESFEKFREDIKNTLEAPMERLKKIHPASHYKVLTEKIREGLKANKRLDEMLIGLMFDPEIQEKINLEDNDVMKEYFLRIAPKDIREAAEKAGLLEVDKSTKQREVSLEEARKADEAVKSVLKDTGKVFKDAASYIKTPSKAKGKEIKEDITQVFEDLGYKLKNTGKGIYDIVGEGIGAVKRASKSLAEKVTVIKNAKKVGNYLKEDLAKTKEDIKKAGKGLGHVFKEIGEYGSRKGPVHLKKAENYLKKDLELTIKDAKKAGKGLGHLAGSGWEGVKGGVKEGIKYGFKGAKYVVGGGVKLGWKGIKKGVNLGWESAGDLVDRVEANYEKIEKKLKAVRPHYILFSLLILAVIFFSISTPSTTTFILFTPESNQLNYKVLFGTILFILAIYITHKETKTA